MATWYWNGISDTSWSNVNNWWSNSNGTGINPPIMPWSIPTSDNAYYATSVIQPPTIDQNISFGISGVCNISSITNIVTVYSGTFGFNGASGFTNNGTIINGTFNGQVSNDYGAYINGGIFSGSNFTNFGLVDGGIFSGSNFINNYQINSGIWTGQSVTVISANRNISVTAPFDNLKYQVSISKLDVIGGGIQ